MTNSVNQDQLASSELVWIYTVCKVSRIRVNSIWTNRPEQTIYSDHMPQFSPRVGYILSWRFDHEMYSMVILSLPLSQGGLLSVSGKSIYNCLEN